MDYIRFYHLRAYDRLHAARGQFFAKHDHLTILTALHCAESLIGQMERNSGVLFHEAQVALARQWITDDTSHDEFVPTEVDIRIPQETTEGLVVSNKSAPTSEKFPIPPTMAEATAKIKRFEAGANNLSAARNVSDNVVQHMLHDVTHLNDEQWDGTEEEELNW